MKRKLYFLEVKMNNIKIDSTTYKLPRINFHKTAKKKTQIVVGNTFSTNMNHYKGWLSRYNGEYKKTAAFTIDKDGNIYQHYDPKYSSDFINNKKVNDFIIPVVIENLGWLINDTTTDKILTWVGDEYINEETMVKCLWRTHEYWDGYTESQLDSLIELSKYLSDKFNIPIQTIGHNTKVDDIYEYRGVVFRSNYQRQSTDLTPAFNYELFKSKLENYG
jgi:N-acetyl-anhydromuramyl-L-alanine amidase AmpD